MINKELFSAEFVILQGRFGREFPDAVRDRYHEILNVCLNDWQFTQACYEIFKTGTYFPTPQQLIDVAPKIEVLLSAQLKRLGLSGELSKEWQQRTGALSIGELSDSDAIAYLQHLREMQNAIEAGQ